jgi:stearoyl-CoA desaturase (delta-9 desaturase)
MHFRLTNGRATALYYIGFMGLILGLIVSNPAWLWLTLSVHLVVVSVFSAVIHRYFCHRAYEANPTLLWLLSFLPVAYGYSSPIGWTSLHSAHHAFSDTERDTHIKGWIGLFTAAYRMPPMKFALQARWFHNKRHQMLIDYGMVVVLVWHCLLALISVDALIWAGLVPMFTLHFCNGMHRVFSHSGTTVMNRWYLEYLFPMGGEWIHDEHHVNARKPIFRNRWYELDTGAWVVKALAR